MMRAWIKEKGDSKLTCGAGGCGSKMPGNHLKELFCRRKEDGVLSSEPVRFQKMVAHLRDGITEARMGCRSGLRTLTRDSAKQV